MNNEDRKYFEAMESRIKEHTREVVQPVKEQVCKNENDVGTLFSMNTDRVKEIEGLSVKTKVLFGVVSAVGLAVLGIVGKLIFSFI